MKKILFLTFVILATIARGQTVTTQHIVLNWTPILSPMPTFPNGSGSRSIVGYNATTGAQIFISSMSTSAQSRIEGVPYRMLTGYYAPGSTTFTPLGNWVNSSPRMSDNTPQYPNKGGPVDPNGVPTAPDGSPVNGVGDSLPPLSNTAAPSVPNPYGVPAVPIWTTTPKNGSPGQTVRGEPVQPGQNANGNMAGNNPFDWNLRWDLGDGRILAGGGGTSSPVATPLPPGTAPITPLPPGTTPPITPPVTGGSTDVTAAVNRHATIAGMYGEAARVSANISNNNLDKISGFLSAAVGKLGEIDTNTTPTGQGSGGGAGSVSIEGDALLELQSIDNTLKATATMPNVDQPDWENIDSQSKKNVTDQYPAKIKAIVGSLTNSVQALSSATNGLASWNFTLPTPFGNYQFNVEHYLGWALDLMRNMILAFICIPFMRRVIGVIRGALTDQTA